MQLASHQINYAKYAQVISKLLELTQKNQITWYRTSTIPAGASIIYGDMYETLYAGTRVFISTTLASGGRVSDELVGIVFSDGTSNKSYSLQGLSGLSSLFQAVYEQTNPQAGLDSILDRIITS